MRIKDPSPVHAAKRSKNFTMLAVIVSLITVLFVATLVRIAISQ